MMLLWCQDSETQSAATALVDSVLGVVSSILTVTKLCNNLGQVVHTNVPLSPSSITWYWSKDSDVLWLGR